MMNATYDPADNKLRLYASARLDAETYARVKAAGFKWAPKQDLFFAPMWTPGREDLLIELCGEIGDEDTSLAERAADRADRFEDYSDKRAADADRAHKAVSAIADNIPLGQPILVGHHSERHARKDAARIENGMRKAVNMWATSKYWTHRAAAALAHADRKERPDVRARRIKGLEADLRKAQKNEQKARAELDLWTADGLNTARAMVIAGAAGYDGKCFTLAEYPRDPPASQYEGPMGLWSALEGNVINPEQAKAIAVARLERYLPHLLRWIAHYENRLAYERAMLGESGYIVPPKSATRAVLPLLNYAGEIRVRNRWNGTVDTITTAPMTKAEYAAIDSDYKGTRIAEDGTHRVRSALVRGAQTLVYLTDAKTHPRPGSEESDAAAEVAIRIDKAQATIERKAAARIAAREHNAALIAKPAPKAAPAPEATAFDAMRESLRAGVQVVTAPQLFPTPAALAERMVELAGIEPGHRVLEPSAGTGNLLRAIVDAEIDRHRSGPAPRVTAIELNRGVASSLPRHLAERVACADFLACSADGFVSSLCGDPAPLGAFDRIVMNPPFAKGADIAHIEHALTMLAPGGRLVALCANGPRQHAALRPIADRWEDLPAGSFAAAGTNVNVALLVIDAPTEQAKEAA